MGTAATYARDGGYRITTSSKARSSGGEKKADSVGQEANGGFHSPLRWELKIYRFLHNPLRSETNVYRFLHSPFK